MPQWEYYVIRRRLSSEEELNNLGSQGWELVSVSVYYEPRNGDLYTLIFKRPVIGINMPDGTTLIKLPK